MSVFPESNHTQRAALVIAFEESSDREIFMLLEIHQNGQIKQADHETTPFVTVLITENGDIEIKQQFFGPGTPIYYTRKDGILFVCDSLRKIKEYTGIVCKLNKDVLPSFSTMVLLQEAVPLLTGFSSCLYVQKQKYAMGAEGLTFNTGI